MCKMFECEAPRWSCIPLPFSSFLCCRAWWRCETSSVSDTVTTSSRQRALGEELESWEHIIEKQNDRKDNLVSFLNCDWPSESGGVSHIKKFCGSDSVFIVFKALLYCEQLQLHLPVGALLVVFDFFHKFNCVKAEKKKKPDQSL